MDTTPETTPPHIGTMLLRVLKKKGMDRADLARALNKNRTGVWKYGKRDSLSLKIIWHMSIVLKHNFFLDLAAQLPDDYATNLPPGTGASHRISQLESENRDLKLQLDLLKEVLRK